ELNPESEEVWRPQRDSNPCCRISVTRTAECHFPTPYLRRLRFKGIVRRIDRENRSAPTAVGRPSRSSTPRRMHESSSLRISLQNQTFRRSKALSPSSLKWSF